MAALSWSEIDFLQPMELANLGTLHRMRSVGYTLTRVKVSPVSSLRGRLLASIDLPLNQRVLCMMRHDQPILELDRAFLRSGDELYVITNDVEATRRFFMF